MSMKTALVIQHSHIETLGHNYTQLLRETGFNIDVDRICDREPEFEVFVPPPLTEVDLVIVLGGTMSANDNYSALRSEEWFLAQAISEQVPVFAICLGAQLLSRALAGSVEATGGFQFGLRKIHVTRSGDRDPVFGALNVPLVPTLHGDSFTIPSGAEILAEGDMLLRDGTYLRINMAFRYGNSYGFQFEPQLTYEEFTVWNRDMYYAYWQMGPKFDAVEEAARNEREFRRYAPCYEEQSRDMLRAFLQQAGLV